MQPLVLADATDVLGGIVFLLVAIPASLLLGFLLFISPLMIWLNVRRLRVTLHADLTALRESVDRLAAGAVASVAPEEEVAASEPVAVEAAAVPPEVPQAADKIGFSCPGCGKFFEGPAALAGTNYTCSECRVEFHIH